ncbi:thioredoxin family protein [Bacillus paranthracis]|nr:thioredoxin family protein [Bacillus paranthracis]
MKSLESMEQFQELKNEENVIFMFSAECDEFIDLCVKLDVFGIPSFVAYNKGEETGRYVNKDRKTQEQIEEFIEGLK